MTPAERDRFRKCLAIAERGATDGERAAGLAAAERIATTAGMTLKEATATVKRSRTAAPGSDARRPSSRTPRRPYAWAQPKEPAAPVTVEELLRQRAETAAWRRRATAAADRRLMKEMAEQAAYEALQREAQAERDREWAAARAETTP